MRIQATLFPLVPPTPPLALPEEAAAGIIHSLAALLIQVFAAEQVDPATPTAQEGNRDE